MLSMTAEPTLTTFSALFSTIIHTTCSRLSHTDGDTYAAQIKPVMIFFIFFLIILCIRA